MSDFPTTDPRLLELLERARKHEITPAEVRAQRVSWVRAETDADEDTIRRALALPSVEEERILADLRSGKLVAVPRPWRAERGSEGFSMNIRRGIVTDYWSANFAFTSRRQRDQVLALIAASPAPNGAAP